MLSTVLLAIVPAFPGPSLTIPAAGTAPGMETAQETVRESRSKVDFPLRLRPLGAHEGAADHRLAGYGLRTKTIFDVHVYAMALYLDPDTTLAALEPFAGKDGKTLQGEAKVYEEILKPSSAKSLRLVMRRGVSAKDMREAFEDALEPRVEKAAKEFEMPGGAEALKRFRTLFDQKKLEKGHVIDFTWIPASGTDAGRLETRVNGERKTAIPNAALGWALFDVYLGGKPIHKKEKPRLVRRLATLLGA